MTHREEYAVDGGAILDGISRIDLVGEGVGLVNRRAVSLFMTRTELQMYPIGARVRVTVERLADDKKKR